MDAAERVLIHELMSGADARESLAALAFHVDGCSHAETASMLGVSSRTVATLLVRFRERARARLRAAPARLQRDQNPLGGSERR